MTPQRWPVALVARASRLTRIAPASRRRARRVCCHKPRAGRLAAALVFSAPATLCTRRTRRLDAEPMAARVFRVREQGSGRQVRSHGGCRDTRAQACRGGGQDGHPLAAGPGRPSGPGFGAGARRHASVRKARDGRNHRRRLTLLHDNLSTQPLTSNASPLILTTHDPEAARRRRPMIST